jgi:hypothetical protein
MTHAYVCDECMGWLGVELNHLQSLTYVIGAVRMASTAALEVLLYLTPYLMVM